MNDTVSKLFLGPGTNDVPYNTFHRLTANGLFHASTVTHRDFISPAYSPPD